MAKLHNMQSADHEISGKPSEYFTPMTRETSIDYPELDASGRGVGGPIFTGMPTSGGTPAMRGADINYPNSNVDGIRNSINDGEEMAEGSASSTVSPGAPQRNPVNGMNPMKPVQRKPRR